MQEQIITTLNQNDLEALIEDAMRRVLDTLPQPKKSHSEDYLTIEQASEFTHIAKATLYDYTHRRKIPFRKVGKRLLFSKKELTEWIDGFMAHTGKEADRCGEMAT